MQGGELLEKLKKQKVFSLETTRFYVSEIVAALAHMHGLKIIHRYIALFNLSVFLLKLFTFKVQNFLVICFIFG